MEDTLYQRPREKLRLKGASFLSVAEIIQIVIGSGGAKLSAAKIARSVQRIIDEEVVTYDSLVSLPGVGDAKACQILAALELGGRINRVS